MVFHIPPWSHADDGEVGAEKGGPRLLHAWWQAQMDRAEALGLLVEAARAGIWYMDVETGSTANNGVLAELYGFPPDASFGFADWLSRVHPEDRARIEACTASIVAGGGCFAEEFRVLGEDGGLRWIHSHGHRMDGPDGRPRFIVGIDIDVTERRVAQEALAASERRYRALAQAGAAVLWRADPGGAVLECSGWEALTGFPEDTVLGRGWVDVIHPDDCAAVCAAWAEALSTEGPLHIECRARMRGGEWRWLRVRAVPVRDDATGALLEWAGSTHDVHDRRSAEAALVQSEAFLRSVLEASLDCIKVLDLDGRTLFMNGSGVRLFEAANFAELEGREWAALWPASAQPLVREAVATAAAGRPVRFEAACPTLRGTPKWWDNAIAPIPGPDGRPERLVCVSRDVTARKRSEDELRRTQAFLDVVLENIPVGVLVKEEPAGRFALVNRATEELTGIRRDRWIGRTDHDLFPKAQADAFRESDRRALQARGAPLTEQEAIDTPHRGKRLVWIRKVPVHGEDGTQQLLIGVVDDVTERRRTEQALRDSEARFARAIAAAGMGTWEWEAATDTLHFSPGYEAFHGRLPGSLSTLSALLDTIHPDDRDLSREAMGRALCGEGGGEFTLEFRTCWPDGTVRWLSLHGKVEFDADGTPLRTTGVTQDITKRKSAEAQVAYMALHDALTDLPNRVALRERLKAALARGRREGTACAVFCLDLDRFKEINDTHGHPAGDALLQAVAARLRAIARDADTIARLDGDEFAVLQVGANQPADAMAFAERLLADLCRPYDVGGHQLPGCVSMGVAIALGDGDDADCLLRRADLALNGAKADGGGRFRFFEPEMQARALARHDLETGLRRALARGEFELVYQPLVNLAAGRISGFEALLRWRHPERGFVPPGEFVPLAEEVGLIVPLGEWVIAQACADAARWPADLKVAVNLSPMQFADPGLVDAVARALDAAGLAPGRLELEITETVLLRYSDETLATLHRLRRRGIGISMDDFGAGYSSLSYLCKFPFDKVKIDQSFVRDLGHRSGGAAIVHAVTGLCCSLGIATTAEGIETPEQLQRVAAEGCTEGQGFFFSPPRPASEIPALLEAWGGTKAPADAGRG